VATLREGEMVENIAQDRRDAIICLASTAVLLSIPGWLIKASTAYADRIAPGDSRLIPSRLEQALWDARLWRLMI
jgi:hypothetical protein